MFRPVGCKPKSVGLTADDDFARLLAKTSFSNSTSAGNGSATSDESTPLTPQLSASACVWSVPVLTEELDVLSFRFAPINGSNVSVTDTHPTLLTYPLPTQATGGTLNLQLTLNSVSTISLTFCLCVFSKDTEASCFFFFFF